MYKPSVFAHRGASGRYFENTMSAFMEAFSQGAHGIELDVQLTEDGVPVVIHDLDLTRVAGVHKQVSSMTYAEIKKIRIGRKYLRIVCGHRIPSLYEVASFCEVKEMGLNVELKETVSERPAFLEEIISIISGLKNVHISSFHYHLLEKVKEVNPEIETAFLVRKKGVDWDNLELYTSADSFHLSKRLFTEPYVTKLRLTQKMIRIYGVMGNEKYVIDPPAFIDGWITDYPENLIIKKKRS
ncbi:glycerophosphodiester phosphodiesterase [Sporosarcina siberiensis]|uniref:Glycerophosphodiester phosphodiesterase n=1 Tax=Sporosarcina siberiensis TaxID=1365606 RepID=A0ABW4SDU3_9BACL